MSTTPTDNKQAIRQLTEAWNDRDREAFLAVHAEEVTVSRPGDEPEVTAAETLWEGEQSGLFTAFPDVTASTEAMIAEDDLVLVCWTVSGTHEGAFHGIEPTGREVAYAEWALYRLEDAEVVEAQWLADALGLFEQLGAVDPPTN
jgi:steroid delta-isomerase-like uncharacterized protein